MRTRYCLIASLLAIMSWTSANAVTVQDPSWVMSDGSAFLWVEAETLLENDVTPADTGYLIVDKVNPYITPAETADGVEIPLGGLPALPEDTNALGGTAILDLNGGGDFADTATYQLQFTAPGRYYLYGHISMFNRTADTSYGNEDSMYLPPAFNKNSSDDWIGWEGVDELGDPMTGDSPKDGWMATPNNRVIFGEEEPGEGIAHNNTSEVFWEGQFWWHMFDVAIEVDENNSYVDDFGQLLFYDVSEEDVGMTLDFEISTREAHGAHDGFLFSTSDVLLQETFTQDQLQAEMLNFFTLDVPTDLNGDFNANGVLDADDLDVLSQLAKDGDLAGDLNGDDKTDLDDRLFWVNTLQNSWLGDSNFDGEFSSSDFVFTFAAAKYETGEMATYAEGDWDGDMLFASGDFVAAFSQAGYEKGPRPAAAAVPEPTSGAILFGSFALMLLRARRSFN